MTLTTTALRRPIGSASDLPSVVRTMQASAASAIDRTRQSGIDEALFDVIAGFDAVAPAR